MVVPMLFLQLGFVILDGPRLVRTFASSLLAQLHAAAAEFGHSEIAAGLLTVISIVLLVIPTAGLFYIVLRTVQSTFRQVLTATRRRPALRFPAVAVALLLAAGLAAHWRILPPRLGGAAPRPAVPGHVAVSRPHSGPPPWPGGPDPVPSVTVRPAGAQAVVLQPVRAAGFDVLESPQEDPGDENSATAPEAIDGNPATAWSTQYYLGRPAFGGLKTGTGLILDMGRPVRISSVTVTFGPEPGADVSLEVGSHDTLAAATLATFRTLARASNVGGTRTFRAAHPVRGRYVLIWFTKLPPAGAGRFAAQIFTIVVRGSA